ncbi:MAG: helix-hairpin-helix domain-containing protein [Gammaproteobacteria bacterium]
MPENTNQRVAERLREAADLLGAQGANPFRVSAYRKAADTVRDLDRDLGAMVREGGEEALTDLPNIGTGIASAIREIVTTGRWSQLERLRGSLDPEGLLATLPGIGPKLAERIHDELHIESLEQLEAAAHEGSLEKVPGVGARRAESVRATLAARLGRQTRRSRRDARNSPGVKLLLEVDADYREKADAGDLPTIAPKRFNPEGRSWLPIMHADREGWHFTALYSNTARAHDLGKTGDWVVVYFYDADHEEGQHTIVTETRGPLEGRRVVRGREAECRDYYGVSG